MSKIIEKKIALELTVDEVNTIIEALGRQPFIKVYKIIEKIHLQSKQQSKNESNKLGPIGEIKE